MQIAPGLHVLDTRKGGRVHCALVEYTDGLILIDTLAHSDGGIVLDYLATIGRKPTDIKIIALTHAHQSHVAGLAEIVRASDAAVAAHEWEIPIIEGKRKATKVGWRIPKPFNLEVMALQAGLNVGLGRHEAVKVTERLREGMRIGPLEVIEVPGHTPGCISFYNPEHRYLIAGDTVSTWPVNPEISWPTFDLDHIQAQRSVAKMAELPVTVCVVGHGDPIERDGQDVLKFLANKKL